MEEACGRPMLHTEYKGITQLGQLQTADAAITTCLRDVPAINYILHHRVACCCEDVFTTGIRGDIYTEL